VDTQDEDRHQRNAQADTAVLRRDDDRAWLASRAEDEGAAAEILRQQGRLDDLAADARDRAAETRHFRAAMREHDDHLDNTMVREFWANRRPTGT
jgi:hypothetical protein